MGVTGGYERLCSGLENAYVNPIDRVYEQTQKAALNCNYLGHIDLDQTVSVTVTVARRDRSTL